MIDDTTPEAMLRQASGQVWEATADPAAAQRLQATNRVSTMISRSNGSISESSARRVHMRRRVQSSRTWKKRCWQRIAHWWNRKPRTQADCGTEQNMTGLRVAKVHGR